MKKLFALLLAVAFCLQFVTGCGEQQGKKRLIVTTVYAAYDLAKQLTAQFAEPCEVQLLLTPGGESHSYEPTPYDAAAVQSCDLFIYVGGVSEQWAEKLLPSRGENLPSLRLFDGITPLSVEDAHDEHEEHEHHEAEYDEHIWTSPLNADRIAAMIQVSLIEMVPEEQQSVEAAYEKLHQSFTKLDEMAKEITEKQTSNLLVFADRFPFLYLTTAYGWEYAAAFTGCSSDTDASAATISALINLVEEKQISSVFVLENSSTKVAETVCHATGADCIVMQSGNNVSAGDFNSEKHLQEIIEQNLFAIKGVLT